MAKCSELSSAGVRPCRPPPPPPSPPFCTTPFWNTGITPLAGCHVSHMLGLLESSLPFPFPFLPPVSFCQLKRKSKEQKNAISKT